MDFRRGKITQKVVSVETEGTGGFQQSSTGLVLTAAVLFVFVYLFGFDIFCLFFVFFWFWFFFFETEFLFSV